MNRSTPGLPVHHQLLKFTQTHVHRVSDAIQPSHPLSSPSPPAPNSLPASGSFPMSQLFAWGGQSTGVSASASVLPMNTQDWSPLGWTGWISLQSKVLSKLHSSHMKVWVSGFPSKIRRSGVRRSVLPLGCCLPRTGHVTSGWPQPSVSIGYQLPPGPWR